MKALRILAIIILILVVVYFVVPLFLADNVIVNEEIDMKAKPATVFRQVNNLQNWLAWSPFEQDPTIVNKFSGPEQGVGANRVWKGDDAGDGSLTILESRPYKYIRNELIFGPGEGGGTGSWNFQETDEGTEVSWTIHIQDLSYPNYRWFGILAEMMLKPMLTQGLKDLKKLVEPMPDPPEIKVVDLSLQPSLVIPDSSTIDSMREMMQRNYKKLFDFIKRMQIPITGQQFAIYHNWNPEGVTRVSVGVPVAIDSKGYKEIKYYEIPATKAIFAKHSGGANSGPTHLAIDDYMKDFNLEARDYIWETYLYDPFTDTDSTKWVTWIYYPLK